jgi:hypothetical protein
MHEAREIIWKTKAAVHSGDGGGGRTGRALHRELEVQRRRNATWPTCNAGPEGRGTGGGAMVW